MDLNTFRKRIEYEGDLDILFRDVAESYDLGIYKSFSPILQGYEDFNIILKTDKNDYFVKVFAKFRGKKEVEQYVYAIFKGENNKLPFEIVKWIMKNPYEGYIPETGYHFRYIASYFNLEEFLWFLDNGYINNIQIFLEKLVNAYPIESINRDETLKYLLNTYEKIDVGYLIDVLEIDSKHNIEILSLLLDDHRSDTFFKGSIPQIIDNILNSRERITEKYLVLFILDGRMMEVWKDEILNVVKNSHVEWVKNYFKKL